MTLLTISLFFSIASKDLNLEPLKEEVLEENARSVSSVQDNDFDILF